MDDPGYLKCPCQHCGNHIAFPTELCGASIKCPHCAQATCLTAGCQALQTEAPDPVAGLPPPHSISAPPTSTIYRLSMVLVACMMLVMPLAYLAILGTVAWAVYYFATHAWSWFGNEGFRLRGIAYFGLFLGGLAVFVAMVTPLLKRRAKPQQPLALNPDVEPALHRFIRGVCLAVGAPIPVRIDLDCQLNASASFKRGALHGREMVLTLGLPLVGALDVRQFAGVLAHEFGHFRQTAGMRLTCFIREVYAWFAEMLYGQTRLDQSLDEGLETGAGSAFVTKFLVELPRLPLRLVFFLGMAASAQLLRQMELDADRCEIEIAGSRVFVSTMRRLRVLGRATERSYQALRGVWTQRRGLPDNFCAFVLQQETLLPGTLRAKLECGSAEKHSLFASHPDDATREAQARKLNLEGLCRATGPARTLFSDFDVVARQVTLQHYTEDLGMPALSGMLFPLPSTGDAAHRGSAT